MFKIKTIIAIIMAIITTICCFAGCFKNNEIPCIYIYTTQAKDVTEINAGCKDDKYTCEQVVVTNGSDEETFSNIELKGRGNSTWAHSNVNKKPYQIKFEDKVSLFGMNESQKWVLLANMFDPSLLRNKVTLDTAFNIGLSSPSSIFVDLYINDEYVGNYQLCEKISGEMVGLEGEYGALCEIDNLYGMYEDDCYFLEKSGAIVVPKDTTSSSDVGYINLINKLNELEKLLYRHASWQKVSTKIDVDSWIKYYFIQELTQNKDCFRSSTFCYCNGLDDTIHLGPVWDFDLALGLCEGPNNEGVPDEEFIRTLSEMSSGNLNWYSLLFEYPEFEERATEIYSEEIAPIFKKLPNLIDSYLTIAFTESAEMDNILYNKFENGPYVSFCDYPKDYNEAVSKLKNFVFKRTNWLNEQFDLT